VKRKTILVVAVGLLAFAAAHAEDGGKLPWVKDHAKGIEQAKKTGKPAVVYFTADW
jgi:hypothetical protein